MTDLPPRAELLSDIDTALANMIDAGQMGIPQYEILASARSGVLDSPVTSQQYQSSALTAQAQMAQVQEINANEFDQQIGLDPEFASAACDCVPGEPCCLRAFEVEDASNSTRKVVWPVPENGPNRLYVVAKDPHNGQPSAKAKVTLTDKDTCSMGFARPSSDIRNHASGPQRISDSDEIVVTTPFQMPAMSSNLLPAEAMAVMYIAGVVMMASSYRNARPASVDPFQCMVTGGDGLEVFAVPHVDANASLTGNASVTFTITALPTLAAGLEGSVTGEVGNQTLQWTGGTTHTNAPRPPAPPQGPVNRHPVFSIVDAIENALSALSNHGTPPSFDYTLPRRPTPLQLVLAFTVNVQVQSIKIEGKGGSPDLQVSVDPFSFSMGPSVTGSLDLLALMLSRIPRGLEIAAYLNRPGGVVRASAQCTITLRGSGDIGYVLQQAVQLTISNDPGWESAFDNIQQEFSAGVEFRGSIDASARIDLETWFITASASAGAAVSTGWNFRGRATTQTNGTVKFEKQRVFQGIELKAYARAEMGASVTNEATETFETGSAETFGTTETSSGVSAQSNMGEPTWERTLMLPEGDDNEWIEI